MFFVLRVIFFMNACFAEKYHILKIGINCNFKMLLKITR